MRVVALCRRGLPIHIGAALLGHLNIQTTYGYVAVFDEDVIQHYQQFLAQRRAERPAKEYREPTTQVRARGPAPLAASMRWMMSPGRAWHKTNYTRAIRCWCLWRRSPGGICQCSDR